MKLKSLIQILGFKGKPRHYPYEVTEYKLGDDVVYYAQWKHPGESVKEITRELVEAYGRYIHEGDFCIDIGAHSGDTTLPMSVAVGKTGCVLALEPNPFIYHVLEKNARANTHVGNIDTIMAASSVEEGFIEFEYSDSGFCNGGRHEGISVLKHGHPFKQEVFCVNLEKELRQDYADRLPRLSFIKVDTEGYDLFVLQAIESIVEECRPVIKAEVYKKTDRQYRTDLLAFFHKYGYVVRKITAEPLDTGVELTLDNLEVGRHYDVLALPGSSPVRR